MKQAILQGGWGYWRTDRYPIGGEFHRLTASIPVQLTGKVIESGRFQGDIEFVVSDGVQGTKGWTGFADPRSIE